MVAHATTAAMPVTTRQLVNRTKQRTRSFPLVVVAYK